MELNPLKCVLKNKKSSNRNQKLQKFPRLIKKKKISKQIFDPVPRGLKGKKRDPLEASKLAIPSGQPIA